MATLIQGGYVIGSDGREHRLIKDGVVVFEEDKIIHVGKSYSGSVDERIDATGKIVSPGLINTHLHSIGPFSPAWMSDISIDEDYRLGYQNPNLLLVPTKSKVSTYGNLGEASEKNYQAGSKWCLCVALKSGATTIVGVGIGRESDAKLYGELGLRAYLGQYVTDSKWFVGDGGEPYQKDFSEEMGRKTLEESKAFIGKHDEEYASRIKGMLYVLEEGCSLNSSLKEVRKAANELNCGIQIHVSCRNQDFVESLLKYKNTPVGRLNDIGFWGPDVIAAHCQNISGHSKTNYPGDDDLKILAKTGTSISHCPLVLARVMSTNMESFQKYMDYGINMTIGTDTWPQDIISEMRYASLISKITDGDRRSARALSVYNAVTINPAKALRRDDLGKLAKGMKADIVIINTKSFRWPPINDPIKCLVHAGTMDDVETVIIDGKKVVEDKKIIGVDEAAVKEDCRRAMEEELAKVPKWDYAGRTIWDIGPMSLKPLE